MNTISKSYVGRSRQIPGGLLDAHPDPELVCSGRFDFGLLPGEAPEAESTSIKISTIADTWIHLSFRVHACESNRALTIIRSCGTVHSNYVRELILSHRSMDLADFYTASREVLMGTLQLEKKEAFRTEQRLRESEAKKQIVQLDHGILLTRHWFGSHRSPQRKLSEA